MKTIIIDPGHGGTDPGACAAGHKESVIALQIAQMVGHFLRAAGHTTILTRESDVFVGLPDRVKQVDSDDLFVSIHANAAASASANGAETWYHGDIAESRNLADKVQHRLTLSGLFSSRGVKSDLDRYSTGFYVLRKSAARGCKRCILVEAGFITNKNDCGVMINDQKQNLAASAIAEGIIEYING
ncbi:MAG: N-acetylmuramoyl-L-alanine amidase [Armatimonadota bacterium]